MDIWSAGFIWHPRRDHQFHLQWSYTDLDKAHTHPHSNILQARWIWVID
jgi:hypothetical protein